MTVAFPAVRCFKHTIAALERAQREDLGER